MLLNSRAKIFLVILALLLGATLQGGMAHAAGPVPPGGAQANAARSPQGRSLASMLNPDGTLRLNGGFSGSLDPTGWTMVTGAAGEPRFVRAHAPGGDKLDPDSGPNGTNGFVNALAVIGTDLYVGGGITLAGGVSARNVARWNGSSWSALGAGTNDTVRALAVIGTDLYVGGIFTQAGGASANYIARWNGSAWSTLGSGVNHFVYALAASGTDLYVGGSFTQAGGVSASYIARWNGSAWSALGSGVNNSPLNGGVLALAVSGTDLYAGGNFIQAGGASANYIARWNGATWSALGAGPTNGVNGIVYALAASGGNLYAGGEFTQAGGASASRIARWSGGAWSPLISGPNNGVNATVRALAVMGTDLYAAGDFTQAGGVSVNYIARWNGSAWSPLGSGISGGGVSALAVSGTDLYAGGSFTQAGGANASRVARWNGSAWLPLKTGPPPTQTPTQAPTSTPMPTATLPPCTFYDVGTSDYFFTAVGYLCGSGAISGYADGTFRPYNTTTRGQLSKIVVLAEGWALANPPTATFSDVPVGSTFFQHVETAVQHGIISGYNQAAQCAPDATPCFRPNNNVTRGQLSKIIVLAEGWALVSPTTPTFVDVPSTNAFYREIETAVAHGIISGYDLPGGTREFRWYNNAIRGQIAKIVHAAVTGD